MRCYPADLPPDQMLLKQTSYKGDPIPYRLLNNYDTNQVANSQVLVENWREVGINVAIEMKENWTQILERGPSRGVRDWSNSATFNDPVSSVVSQHGPNGEQQQYGEWTNAEMHTLSCELETSTDMTRRRVIFARMLQIREREDPAYTVLHQNATFTGKQKAIKWRAAPTSQWISGPRTGPDPQSALFLPRTVTELPTTSHPVIDS